MAQYMSLNRSSIAKFIRDKRTSLGWSQRELSRRLGCPHATVQQWESEKTTPDTEKLVKLASLFGLQLSEFFAAVEGDSSFSGKQSWNLNDFLETLDSGSIPTSDVFKINMAIAGQLAKMS
jgi:transcriptional regulator with XRE-family HTH domain